MSKHRAVPFLIVLALVVVNRQLASAQPDEPLPEGARLRLGSSGLSVGDGVLSGTISPDGKYIAASGRGGVALFDRKTGKRLAQIGEGGDMGRAAAAQLAFSPQGKTLAVCSGGTVQLVEVPTGKTIHRFETGDETIQRGKGLCFSADGKVVALGMDHRGAKKKPMAFAWDATAGTALGAFEVVQSDACGTALSRDGKLLASWGRHTQYDTVDNGSAARTVQLWDLATGKELRVLKIERPNGQITGLAFIGDGKQLCAAVSLSGVPSSQTTLHTIDIDSGKEQRRVAGHRGLIEFLQSSPDGKTIVAAYLAGAMQASSAVDGKRIDLPPGPKGRLQAFAFPADGQMLVLSLVGQTLAWWDAAQGSAASATRGHQAPVNGVAFAADGKSLVSASADGRIVRWDVTSGKLLRQLLLADEETIRAVGTAGLRYTTLTLSPDGRFAATGSMFSGNNVRLWDLANGQIACDFETAKALGLYGMAFTPRGNRLASANAMKYVNVWDSDTGQDLGKFSFEAPAGMAGNAAPRLAYSPDAKTLAVVMSQVDPDSGIAAARLIIIDAANGKEIGALNVAANSVPGPNMPGNNQLAANVAYSPDSRLLAIPGPSQAIFILRVESGKELKRIETSGGTAGITALAFSPDGRTIAIAYGGQRSAGPGDQAGPDTPVLELCEVASGKSRVLFKGQQGNVNCLAFSPDGLTVSSGSTDSTVMLWDTTGLAGTKVAALTGAQTEAAWALLAKPDGQAAFDALRKLIGSPTETLAFLKKRIPPAKELPINAKKISQWIAELDSETFETRDDAYRSLDKLGSAAEAALRKVREGKLPLEMRRRIDDLIDKLERGVLMPEDLQATRAVEVLERIATAEAREFLAALAKGAPSAALTVEARKALGRMQP